MAARAAASADMPAVFTPNASATSAYLSIAEERLNSITGGNRIALATPWGIGASVDN